MRNLYSNTIPAAAMLQLFNVAVERNTLQKAEGKKLGGSVIELVERNNACSGK